MSVDALILLSEMLGDGWVVSTEIKDWTEPIRCNMKVVIVIYFSNLNEISHISHKIK